MYRVPSESSLLLGISSLPLLTTLIVFARRLMEVFARSSPAAVVALALPGRVFSGYPGNVNFYTGGEVRRLQKVEFRP
jgi:hypothetical protein